MSEYKLKLNKDGETGILTIIEDGDEDVLDCELEEICKGVWQIHTLLSGHVIIGHWYFTLDKKRVFNVFGDDIKILTKKELRFFENATNGSYRKFYRLN